MDHAWTYLPDKCREQLFSVPGLAQRMANLMDLLQRPSTPADAWSVSSDGSEEEEEREPEVNGLASSDGEGASEGIPSDSVARACKSFHGDQEHPNCSKACS